MGYLKTVLTPLLTHWNYHSLALHVLHLDALNDTGITALNPTA